MADPNQNTATTPKSEKPFLDSTAGKLTLAGGTALTAIGGNELLRRMAADKASEGVRHLARGGSARGFRPGR